MIKLKNVNTGITFDYEDELGKNLLLTNKFDFELVSGSKEIREEIKEAEVPTDEALILGKKKRKKN